MEVASFHLMPWPKAGNNVAWPYSEAEFDPELGSEVYENYLEQLAYCEDLGFDSIGLNEHHYTAYGLMPNPSVTASNLIERTDDIEIAIMGNILPIRGNPIRVAEEMAMLDTLSEGRMLSGFVRGIPTEYAAFGINPSESRDRFAEAWDLVTKAWTAEEPFDWEGEYWEYDDVYIWPRPYQDPHPPLWMPSESQKSIEFAAERQVPTGNIYVDTQTIAEGFDHYRQVAREKYNWEPTEEYFWLPRMTYVAETMEQAREEAEEHLEYFYDTLFGGLYRAGVQSELMEDDRGGYREEESFDYADHAPEKGAKAMNFDFDELQESGEIIVGTPEYVTEEIERQYEEVGGFSRFVGLFQFGSLPHDLTIKNHELFADEVMPEIRKLN